MAPRDPENLIQWVDGITQTGTFECGIAAAHNITLFERLIQLYPIIVAWNTYWLSNFVNDTPFSQH